MSRKNIENQFEAKGKQVGGIFLLQPSDALDFIKACQREGLPMVGVEGFKLIGHQIQPFQEHSNDIADTNLTQDKFYEETIKFILARKNDDIWFEIVLAGANEN